MLCCEVVWKSCECLEEEKAFASMMQNWADLKMEEKAVALVMQSPKLKMCDQLPLQPRPAWLPQPSLQ